MPHPFTNLIRHISEVIIEENDEDDEQSIATKLSIAKLTKLLEKIEEDGKPELA